MEQILVESGVLEGDRGLFRQRLAETAKEKEADESGRAIEIPDDYVRGEQARLARAVLMAMAPDIAISELTEAA